MGIYDELKAERKYNKGMSEAELIFMKQKNAIKSLEGTNGLNEIRDYWERQKEINESMYENAKMGDKPVYFALYKQSKMFLNFIVNLLK